MKNYIGIFVISFLFAVTFQSSAYCGIDLTEKQFKYIELLDKELRKKFPEFKGFNGSKEDMQGIGLSDETLKDEIKKIDIDSLLPQPTDKKKTIRKFKALGFDKEDMRVMKILKDNEEDPTAGE